LFWFLITRRRLSRAGGQVVFEFADAPLGDGFAQAQPGVEGLPVAIDELSTKADVIAGHSLGFDLCAPSSQDLNRSS
jgi:hypothetical protein